MNRLWRQKSANFVAPPQLCGSCVRIVASPKVVYPPRIKADCVRLGKSPRLRGHPRIELAGRKRT
eukprot:scaffold238678_cov28-Tisochrysis_lutea.AAC.2